MPKLAEISNEQEADTIFQNPAMLSMLQGRLGSLIGQSSGYIKSLPQEVQGRIAALKNIQDKHAEIEARFQDEVLALKKKFMAEHAPLYTKRSEIISGAYEPSKEEATREDSDIEDDEDEEEEKKEKTSAEEKKKDAEPVKGIPEFWLTALKTHPAFSEIITEKDEAAMRSLKDVKYAYLDSDHGFRLEFVFDENEHLPACTLTKTYHLVNSPEMTYGEVMFDHAEGCDIPWKEGKDLTVTIETKKQRHKASNKTRVVKKVVPCESFFNFFKPPKIPGDDDEDEEDVEALEEDLEQAVEQDYDLGEILKEKIIPNAIDWFTGKALQYEDMMDDYDEEDEEDYDIDEDDDDEEEGEDGAPVQQPECKQQ